METGTQVTLSVDENTQVAPARLESPSRRRIADGDVLIYEHESRIS